MGPGCQRPTCGPEANHLHVAGGILPFRVCIVCSIALWLLLAPATSCGCPLRAPRRVAWSVGCVFGLYAHAPSSPCAGLCVQEFLLSEDLCEVASSLKELEIPHFHHEVVKRGMVLAMDKNDAACELVSTLFTFLFAEGVVAGQQFDIGFQRVKEVPFLPMLLVILLLLLLLRAALHLHSCFACCCCLNSPAFLSLGA